MKKQIDISVFILTSLFVIAAFVIGCRKEVEKSEIGNRKSESSAVAEAAIIPYHIGDANKTPDLYIPELEFNWQYWTSGLGLRSEGTYVAYNNQAGQLTLAYNCWIANGAPIDYSGQNDFVVCRSCDGIKDTSSYDSYNFPGMLSITTFQSGLPIYKTIKQRFFVLPSDAKIGFSYTSAPNYPEGYMYIYAGTADNYRNSAPVNYGKNLIVVEVNPDTVITETNLNNNVGRLPVNVSGYTGVLDLSVIDENKTVSASELTVSPQIKGRRVLSWNCPYHESIYVKHWFTIYKDGQLLEDHLQTSSYTLKGNYKGVYSIVINVVGLEASEPVSINVTK